MFAERAIVVAAVLAQLYGSSIAFALPTEVVRGIPRPNTQVPCDSISKYTTQFFEDHLVFRPAKDQCLFYTRGLTKAAQAASEGNAATTIWDLFPCALYKPDIVPYDPAKDPENPLRCIFTPKGTNADGRPEQSDDELTYFSNMSRAMARYCNGVASVMNVDVVNLNGGIWATVEFPALKADGNPGGTVTQVNKVDTMLQHKEVLWTRGTPNKMARGNTTSETSSIIKRTPPVGKPQVRCYSPEQLEAIDITPW